MLKVWNTLHRELEEFKPIKAGEVGMYTCGPTVYNPVTLGNWRAFIFDDVLHRSLEFFGYQVKHVMNITDVGHLVGDGDEGEDKIEREAVRQGKTAQEIARHHEAAFREGMKRLHITEPNFMPRATEHIPEQIALIQQLEKKGATYRISDGIYFDTSKFLDYGKLSGQALDEKKAGTRVAVNPEKRHSSDFALWKFSYPNGRSFDSAQDASRRHMEWESPWGTGFPGWHIECSAMSVKYLGQPFDIHCGGVDHLAVHHENEIAQTEAASGKSLAHYWLHNEFLLVDGRRMGKSEGNAYTLDDVIARGFDPLAFRYYCLGTHYRQKMNFTWEGLEAAQNALNKLWEIARSIESSVSSIQYTQYPILNTFQSSLEDDLNTPQALAVMWEMLKSDLSDEEKRGALLKMDDVLGLHINDFFGKKIRVPIEVKKLAEERQKARQEKQWEKADELRKKIRDLGWEVEDQENGFEVRVLT
ncbi:MAG: cysteine--tRNA ligase [Candidatus Uhrbacteria bacterium]|nr:cysteine--tRNA ligase [Candidatus Uhrbacteria bacterium]